LYHPCFPHSAARPGERRQQIARHAVTEDATKVAAIPATKSNNATKGSDATKVKIGRPLICDHPMTNTERSRRYRARQKAAGTTTALSS